MQGALVHGFLRNSHYADFNEIDPQTVEDCTTLLIAALRDELQDLQ